MEGERLLWQQFRAPNRSAQLLLGVAIPQTLFKEGGKKGNCHGPKVFFMNSSLRDNLRPLYQSIGTAQAQTPAHSAKGGRL